MKLHGELPSPGTSPGDWPDITLDHSFPPTMRLGGRHWFGLGAHRPYLPPHLEIYERLAGQGVRQFQCDATCAEDIYHPQLRFWHGPDDFGSPEQETQFASLLEIQPDALIQLRIYVGCPEWWLDRHPGECQIYGDGGDRCSLQRTPCERLPSLASERWRRDACAAMRRYVRWLVEKGWSRHVSGLFICNGITWECSILGSDRFPDYSPQATLYFRQWLRDRYRSREALEEAWGRPVTFEEAVIPSQERRLAAGKGLGLRPVPAFQDVVDHQLCLSDKNADLLLAVAAAAREESGGHVPIGTFYGYTLTAREQTPFTGQYGAGGFQGGHHALGRVLRSPDIDFIASPFNYANRDLGTGLLMEHVPLASIHAHGKAFFDENDLYAFNNPQSGDDRASGISVGFTETREETLSIFRMALAQSIVRGKHQWFIELTGWIGEVAENFSDPELLREIARLNLLGEELISADRSSVTETAFVIDEKSVAYLPLDSRDFLERVYHGSVRWGHLGAPFDLLLLEDLLTLGDVPYKLVVPACIKSPSALRDFSSWMARHPGVHVLWDGAPDYFPPATNAPLIEAMTVAGVHRYVEAPVTVWANRMMVLVHNSAPGILPVKFTGPCKGRELFSGWKFEASEGTLEWSFGECDVALFQIHER